MYHNQGQGSGSGGRSYGTFYHHTSREAAERIYETGRIYPSTDTVTDAMAGPGTYVTKMGPKNHPIEVAQNNYDGNWEPNYEMGKTDVAIQMTLPKHILTRVPQPGRSIYVKRGHIDLNRAHNVKFHYRDDDGNGFYEKYD